MKTFLLPVLIACLGCGCASRYDITMVNGNKITARGKPKLNADKTAWYFTDAAGNPARISAGSVEQVAPQSLDQEDNKFKFKPAK